MKNKYIQYKLQIVEYNFGYQVYFGIKNEDYFGWFVLEFLQVVDEEI